MNVGENLDIIREGLTLQLFGDEMSFKLAEKENLGPDDWAWLFLSMNGDYSKAYEEQSKKRLNNVEEDPNLKIFLGKEGKPQVFADCDGSCRKNFGLAAWLSPAISSLPPLINGGSWFFPLKSPVLEDYKRTVVGNELYISDSGPLFQKYPYLVALETPFGYRQTRTVPRSLPNQLGSSWGLIWAAVDCSIPPEGQMSALCQLAASNRKYLRGYEFKTYDCFDPPHLACVGDSDAFAHMKFSRSHGATQGADASKLWQAVCIDALGPIASQATGYLKLLRQKHRALLNDKLTQSPMAERFMNTLPTVNGRHGGCHLKALHIVAELSSWGHGADKIAEIVGVKRKATGYVWPWHQQFFEDINKYIDESRILIDGGYKWLVHAQKPEPMVTET